MSKLHRQRCFNHGGREAVAMCTSCRRYYCRECTTEHEGVVTCAACLREQAEAVEEKQRKFGPLLRLGQAAFAFIILWLTFYVIAQTLVKIPTKVYDGGFGLF